MATIVLVSLGFSGPLRPATGGPARLATIALDPDLEPGKHGVLFSGTHEVIAVVPMSAPVADYQNTGYTLHLLPSTLEEGFGRRVRITVQLDSQRSQAPYPQAVRTPQTRLGRAVAPEIVRLAQSLVHGSHTLDSAVTKLVSWTARSVHYHLDRSEAQDAESVLRRRTAYCTGSAALAVALLRGAGIEAREVAGYSLVTLGDRPAGYHRWIEVYYPDLGWRFSDPNASLGFVSANYVRLEDRKVPEPGVGNWMVFSEVDHRRPVTGLAALPAKVVGRYQGEGLGGASLRVDLPAAVRQDDAKTAGRLEVELSGPRWIRRRRVRGGRADFVDLGPGHYRVNALLGGRPVGPESSLVVEGIGSFELVLGADL